MPTPPVVPIPSTPTNPQGGSGNSSTYFGLTTNYEDGAEVVATDLDKLINLIDNELAAALAAVGSGTLIGGVPGSPAGLNVPVSAWRGILPNSTGRIGYAGAMKAAATVAIPASSTFVVWAVPITGAYTDSNAYDTAESGIADYQVVTDGSTPDGGTPLFSGTSLTSSVTGLTDQRFIVGIAELQAAVDTLSALESADVAAIKAALGLPYFPVVGSGPSSVDARLSALEQGSGTTGSGGGGTTNAATVYWDTLARTVNSTQTIAAYVQSQLPTVLPAGTPLELTDDVVVVNVLKNALAQINTNGAGMVDRYLDCMFCVPGITDNAVIDLVHTTAPIDYANHLIG